MAKEICISSTPHETRLAILEDDLLTEVYYERENEYTLAGSIYKGRVTRVLPGMQSAFVDVGLERDAFLYVTDFLEEAGDSADFERMGTQAPRAENSIRAPREGRQRAEARVEPRAEGNQNAVDLHTVELTISPPLPEEGREEETDGTGTRRWRGRRGRRRSGARSAAPRETGQVASSTQPTFEATEPPFEAVDSIDMLPYDDTVSFMDASAAPPPEARPVSEELRRDSGRKSAQHKTAHDRSPQDRAPTIVLPGESLSKYGAKRAESAGPAAAIADPVAVPLKANPGAFKPKTLVDTPVLLEGGSLLAGESILRHRRPARVESVASSDTPTETAQPASPEEWTPVASGSDVSDQEIAHADDHLADAHVSHDHSREEHTAQEERPHQAPEEHAFANSSAEHSYSEHAGEHVSAPVESPQEPAEFPALEPAPAAHEDTESQLHEIHGVAAPDSLHSEEGLETEPMDASASHKVDASAPSAFRLPWFSDKTKAKESVTAEVTEPNVSETVNKSQPQDAPADPHHASDSTGHQAAEPIPEQFLEATSATYETEIAYHDEEGARLGGVDSISGFAPGAGLLEEEIIDDDEFDFAPLHAHSDEHELDELEEETIDQQMGGAELGEMVREAALDQRINIPFGSNVSSDQEAEDDVEESAADLAEAEAYGEESSEEAAPVDNAAAPSRRIEENRRGGRARQGRRGRSGQGNSGGHSGGGRRQNTQPSDLPVISDLLKQGQEILVQIAKEPIAKKGARITSHIALPGRFLVFMPTVNHVGVSRKISSDEERQRLKRILISEKGDAIGGFIVRTAAATASEEDLRADIRFLLSLWTGIKERSDSAKAPALIYHDLNLVERVLRDQVSDNFSSIWVDNEVEYERIVRFLQRFQPSLVRRVKLYTKETPLFEQFNIQDEITKALKSKVWLKSGGSIVINQTEALVAIDINTGKYVGKTARLEDTIVKTNLDAIAEIVRQIRLRDLGGIIVIDFIDMDERKNRQRVMLALEEALKADRAPSKVLQFNDFGLVAITRKRVKQSLERTLSVQCEVCTGTGMVKSPTTVCNEIYIEMRKMHRTFETPDVLLRVNPEVVKTLKGSGARWLTEMEEMISKNIIVKSDPALHPEQFDIH